MIGVALSVIVIVIVIAVLAWAAWIGICRWAGRDEE